MTGIYAHYAGKYWEAGFCPIPVKQGKKACFIKGWGELFGKALIKEDDLDQVVDRYGDQDIGITLGKPSSVIGVDYDWEGESAAELESLLIGLLPPTPCIKQSRPGRWTRFYRFNEAIPIQHLKRSGKAFVDILSTGALTVLPPSIHSKGLKYSWVGPSLLDVDRDEIPIITPNIIRDIKDLAEFNPWDSPVERVPRHDKLLGFFLRQSEWCKTMDELTTKLLMFDEKINGADPKGAYFADPKYIGSKSSDHAARAFVEKLCDWKKKRQAGDGIEWEIGKSTRTYKKGEKPSTLYADFKSFLDHRYPDTRVDLFTRTAFCKMDGEWRPLENRQKIIESEVSQVGLTPTYTERHLQKWISEKKPKLLLDIPVWDRRKDHIKVIADAMTITNIDHTFFVELLKEWMGMIFSRVTNPSDQNHFMVFRGPQGIGKDFTIRKLCGGFYPYFDEIALSADKRENYRTVHPLAIAHIPEFDETDGIPLSVLKSLITAFSAFFRSPYEKKAERAVFRTSFVSSANFPDLLRDSSGNRRFMIFDVAAIKYGFADNGKVDPVKIMGQAYALHREKYKASKEARDEMTRLIAAETPVDNSALFIEEATHVITSRINVSGKLRWADIADSIADAGRKYRYTPRRMQQILKRAGLTKRDKDSTYYVVNH